jgi:hypothetical protein
VIEGCDQEHGGLPLCCLSHISSPTGCFFQPLTERIAREQPPIRVDLSRAPELCESAKGEVKQGRGADPF